MLLRAFAFGIPVGIAFVDCVGYVVEVDGCSMQPCLNPDQDSSRDWVLINKLGARRFNYSRGEVVSLMKPKNPSELLIKRVIGLPGDRVETLRYHTPVVTVPAGHCWVEGDNSSCSYDSNHFGPVPLGLLTGKAEAIVWPPSRWQRLQTFTPVKKIPVY